MAAGIKETLISKLRRIEVETDVCRRSQGTSSSKGVISRRAEQPDRYCDDVDLSVEITNSPVPNSIVMNCLSLGAGSVSSGGQTSFANRI